MAVATGLFLWGRHYLTGIDEIDRQHEEIAILLNQLHESRRSSAPHHRQRILFDSLISSVGEHFRTEESLMRKAGYEELELHKLEHDGFVAKVMVLREEFDSGDGGVPEGGLEFVKEWLRDHLMTSDRRMGRLLSRRLGNRHP